VFCALGRRPHASWNVPVGLWKKIQCPVFIRVEAGKFPPEGSKSRIFGCFREELPPQHAGGLSLCRVRHTLKSVMNLPFAIHYAGDAKSAEIQWECIKYFIINKLNFAFK
jgi:hypothetical protein